MANEGTIRIHRSIAGTGAAFRVAFVPYDAEAEEGGERSFRELQQVRAFLKMLGLGAEYIRDALRQLTAGRSASRSEEHTSELQSRLHLVCRLLLEKKKKKKIALVSSYQHIDQ